MSQNLICEKIKHVAIIMDGNGRWAQERAHRRLWGHVRGSRVVSNIVEQASDLGLKALTLYAFSTENWSRPLPEVQGLFHLLKKFLKQEEKRILENNIRFKVIGDSSRLPEETQKLISDLENKTQDATGLKLSFAFSYGGRDELLRAMNAHIQKHPGEKISEESFTENLMTADCGDVDLLIRTGGDQRISNFLLWQVAYAELYFTQTKWPEFTPSEFENILKQVAFRERRFGSVGDKTSFEEAKQTAKAQEKLFERK